MTGARQLIADGHPNTCAPLDKHDVAGFYFLLHGLTASIRRAATSAKRAAQFSRSDQNVHRAAHRGEFQLCSQFLLVMIDGNH